MHPPRHRLHRGIADYLKQYGSIIIAQNFRPVGNSGRLIIYNRTELQQQLREIVHPVTYCRKEHRGPVPIGALGVRIAAGLKEHTDKTGGVAQVAVKVLACGFYQVVKGSIAPPAQAMDIRAPCYELPGKLHPCGKRGALGRHVAAQHVQGVFTALLQHRLPLKCIKHHKLVQGKMIGKLL